MSAARSQKATDYSTARYAVMGALETLERLTRPDGIPMGEHVPRQAARALRSAADLLDPSPTGAFEPLNTVPYFSERKFEGFVSVGALQRDGLPAVDRYLEREAEEHEGRVLEQRAQMLEVRKHAEGI